MTVDMSIEAVETNVANRLVDGLTTFDDNRDRSVQSAEGRLGMSDLGFCRNKALLKLSGAERDRREDDDDGNPVLHNWPANVGSAIHNWIEEAFADESDVLIGRKIGKVEAAFPRSGTRISGTPDLVIPGYNLLLDVKTVNRIEPHRRGGVSQNHAFQRHAYAMGCVDRGLLVDDGTLLVGNAYFDRSGKDRRPWVSISSFDPTMTDVIDQWIEDVLYAYTHNEEAMRDIPAARCPHVCEFVSVCRGGVMEDTHEPTLIVDDETLNAIAMYAEGKRLASQGENLLGIAKDRLVGVSGSGVVGDDRWQVRWVHVNPSDYPAGTRSGYDRLDVRKIKR